MTQAENTLRAERASNGRWIVARYNAGGNRKAVRECGDHRTQAKAEKALAEYEENDKQKPTQAGEETR